MSTRTQWTALAAMTKIINGDASAPTLKNLANAAQKLGNEIDPTGGGARDLYANFILKYRGTSAPTAGLTVDLYLITKLDGTTYEDGDDSVVPHETCFACSFDVTNVSTQQRIPLWGIPIPPCKFKPLIINRTGVAMTNTDNENELYYDLQTVEGV